MRFQLTVIANAVTEADGLPRVDWDTVNVWLAQHVLGAERRSEARLEAVLQWLELLADRLGDDYWINSAPRCVLLTDQPKADGDSLLRFAEQALDHIARLLDSDPQATTAPRHILVRLHRLDLYYSYINHFYEDGEYGGSGGMCIREGMPHIVFPRTPGGEHVTIAHELAHAVLNAFDAPLWVEEGVAQIVEQQVTGARRLQLDHEIAGELRVYWQAHALDDFWSGKSFYAADEGQQSSYRLAEILVRLILADHRPRFLAFLEDAKREDAGEAAAVEHFGKSLSKIAGIFLEK